MPEERDDIVVLVDENGEEEEFEFVDTVEMDGNEYVILSPVSEDENDNDDFDEEVVILKVDKKEDGEESFVTVENEDELDAVFEEFKMRIEDDYYFDFDEEDEDDEDEEEDDDDDDEL
ncbi:MAG TPA: DUF1292 domain-containing protein [Clostridiales bacterium]|nr:DUF1292 domain-containing protein [Clostridiales bacterium]